MLWLLQAVMTPERENTLRSALATSMMGLNALDIETLNNDEHAWDAVVRVRWLSANLAQTWRYADAAGADVGA